MTRDLLQFVNNGVPIYKLLGDLTGKNTEQLQQMAEHGELSFDLLNRAFQKATSEGGQFFEGTLKLSQTLGGQLSTLRDNITLMLADFGQVIGSVMKPLIQMTINTQAH